MSEPTTDSGAPTVLLGDEAFRVRRRVSKAALMRFAHVAKAKGTTEMDQWDALYTFVKAALAPDEDYERFLDVADRIDADDDVLMAFVVKVIAGQTERPTSLPSDSSDGPTITEPKSESAAEPSNIYDRVIRMHEKSGRPDKAAIVLTAQEEQATSVA